MLTSTLHLLIAQKIAAEGVMPLNGRFLLGNLAPDAVMIRSGYTRELLNTAHLNPGDWAEARTAAVQLLKEFSGDVYIAGAAIHILVDILWFAGPYRNFLKIVSEGRDAVQVRRVYAADMDSLERYFFRQQGTDRLWAAAVAAQPQDLLGLVTASEVDRWRKIRYAELQEAIPQSGPEILSLSEIMNFMEEASDRIVHLITSFREEQQA